MVTAARIFAAQENAELGLDAFSVNPQWKKLKPRLVRLQRQPLMPLGHFSLWVDPSVIGYRLISHKLLAVYAWETENLDISSLLRWHFSCLTKLFCHENDARLQTSTRGWKFPCRSSMHPFTNIESCEAHTLIGLRTRWQLRRRVFWHGPGALCCKHLASFKSTGYLNQPS